MIDQKAIDERRISIEDSEIAEPRTYKRAVWYCHYCTRKFASENIFTRHFCEEKRRSEEIKSPLGQAAFSYFTIWMKARKHKEQKIEAFLESRYYKSFIRFASMVIAAGISNPEKYIRLMVDASSITPDLWCREQCYKIYLDWMDKQDNPMEQVESSISCIMDLADRDSVPYEKVIEFLGPQRILKLIQQRRLSPWYLLHSDQVKTMLKSLDQTSLKSFDQAINISAWVERLKEHGAIRKDIIEIIKELKL